MSELKSREMFGLDWEAITSDPELAQAAEAIFTRQTKRSEIADCVSIALSRAKGEIRSGRSFRIMRNSLRLLKHSAILHHKIDFFQRIHVGQRIA